SDLVVRRRQRCQSVLRYQDRRLAYAHVDIPKLAVGAALVAQDIRNLLAVRTPLQRLRLASRQSRPAEDLIDSQLLPASDRGSLLSYCSACKQQNANS